MSASRAPHRPPDADAAQALHGAPPPASWSSTTSTASAPAIRQILELEGYEVDERRHRRGGSRAPRSRRLRRRPARLPPARHRRPDHLHRRSRRNGRQLDDLHDHRLRQHRHGHRGHPPGSRLLPAQALHARRPAGRRRDPGASTSRPAPKRSGCAGSTRPACWPWPRRRPRPTPSSPRCATRCWWSTSTATWCWPTRP